MKSKTAGSTKHKNEALFLGKAVGLPQERRDAFLAEHERLTEKFAVNGKPVMSDHDNGAFRVVSTKKATILFSSDVACKTSTPALYLSGVLEFPSPSPENHEDDDK